MNRPELEQGWRTRLQQPQPPRGFAQQLHHNLTMQLQTSAAVRGRHYWRAAVAGCATLVLGMTLLFVGAPSPPPLIAAAQAHAAEERGGNDIDLTYGTWLRDAGYGTLPPGSRVAMAKDCVVAGRPAKHLRVALNKDAQADLFITRTEGGPSAAEQGEIAGRSWWRLYPQTDIAVVVLFDAAVTSEQQRQWTQQFAQS